MKYLAILAKKMFLVLLTSVVLVAPVSMVSAQDVLESACQVPGSTLCEESKASQSATDNKIYGPNGIITKAVELLSFVIGFAAVVMIIIGGFKYVLSAGDPNSVNSAKNTILYAVIGLVIAALAQAIIIFVVNKL